MFKKVFSILALVSVVGLLVAGCGKGEENAEGGTGGAASSAGGADAGK